MLESLRHFVESIDPLWQWAAIISLGAIPNVESYLGSALGVVAGVSPFVAIPAAAVGNWVSMYLFVMLGGKIYQRRKARSSEKANKKRQKLKKYFDKFGVPGVSLFGQWILPSQVVAMVMVTFGSEKRTVILWQTIAIILYGILGGTLAWLGVDVLLQA